MLILIIIIGIVIVVAVVTQIVKLRNKVDQNAASKTLERCAKSDDIEESGVKSKEMLRTLTSVEVIKYLKGLRNEAREFMIEEGAKGFLREYIEEIGVKDAIREIEKGVREQREIVTGKGEDIKHPCTTNYRITQDEERVCRIMECALEKLKLLDGGLTNAICIDEGEEYEVRMQLSQLYEMGILPWGIIVSCGGSIKDTIRVMHVVLEGDYYDEFILRERLHEALGCLYGEKFMAELKYAQILNDGLIESVSEEESVVDFYEAIKEELKLGSSVRDDSETEFAADIIMCMVYNHLFEGYCAEK